MSEESGLHSKRADGAGKLVCRAWLVVQAADQNHTLLNCPRVPFSLLKDTQFRKKEFWHFELACAETKLLILPTYLAAFGEYFSSIPPKYLQFCSGKFFTVSHYY